MGKKDEGDNFDQQTLHALAHPLRVELAAAGEGTERT